MNVEYFYCSKCGYKDEDIYVSYSRTCSSGDICICPICGKESSNIKTNDE